MRRTARALSVAVLAAAAFAVAPDAYAKPVSASCPGGAAVTGTDGRSDAVGPDATRASTTGPDAKPCMAGQDEGGRDDGAWDAGGQDAGGQNAGGQDTGGQNAGGQNAGGQDTGGRDEGAWDTGGQDAGGQDTGGRGDAGHDCAEFPGDPSCAPPTVPHGAHAGEGGTFDASVPALAAGAVLIAAAGAGAVYRMHRRTSGYPWHWRVPGAPGASRHSDGP
ncbi:hypothetical protein [Streptomyces sp. NPDC020298]|uniref:hypothetical protein n=1 Tax=unclassified Streptomyces TaxID=2593676 RepID=UPI0033DDE9D9